MKFKNFLVVVIICIFGYLATPTVWSQSISGADLLERAIRYHDPHNKWPLFNETLKIELHYADGSIRQSTVSIDLPGETFSLEMRKKGDPKQYYRIEKGVCTTPPAKTENTRTACQSAKRYRDYYTYLYGLPMKLRDPGTLIDPIVDYSSFKGKDYLLLKVRYDETIGSDVWYFYFDPETYRMEVYQFFKGDPDGPGKDTGEYILLSEEAVINDIRMPRVRAWYYNKDNKYLGTDILKAY